MSDWLIEVERRRFIRDKYPPERTPLPTEPDLRAAEHFDPTSYYGTEYDPVEERMPGGVEVYDDRIVIPREVTDEAEDYLGFVEEYILPAYEVMPVYNPQDWKKADTPERYYTRDSDTGELVTRRYREKQDPRPMYVRVSPDNEELDELTKLQNIWKKRRRDSRDLKMLITARDSQTGTGKTTLAVALSKSWDEHGWDVSKATLSPNEYTDMYTELNSGEILLGDELEQMADNRRSMSNNNLTLTQFWSTMRQWEVSTICTLPSASMVDKRLKELADIRINVIKRGVGVAYKTKIDDHSGEIREKRLHRVRWNALDDDEDYRHLSDMKEEHMENHAENLYFEDDEEEDRLDEKELRNQYIEKIYEATDLTQREVAEAFDLSRSTVSKVLSD